MGKLSRYITSHAGQLSLAILTWVGEMSTSLAGKVWRRTGHAAQTIVVYPPTGSTAYEREMSSPPTLLWSTALLYLYLLTELQTGNWRAGELDGDVPLGLDARRSVRAVYVLHELHRPSARPRSSRRQGR